MSISPKSSSTRPAPAPAADLEARLAALRDMSVGQLQESWQAVYGSAPPKSFTKDLLMRAIAYRLQEQVFGGLDAATKRLLKTLAKTGEAPRQVKVGSIIVREHRGVLHEVMVVPGGFCWDGRTYDSLSTIAREITGVRWNGPRFFGLRAKEKPGADSPGAAQEGSSPMKPRLRTGLKGTGGRRSTIAAPAAWGHAR